MKITLDLHTHTTYSHGKGTILENALSAKEKGISGIAITDHGFSHPAFGMRRRKVAQMRSECASAEQQTGVKVLLGIESNIRGRDGTIDVKLEDYKNLDVCLAGVHKFIFYKTQLCFLLFPFARQLIYNAAEKKKERNVKGPNKLLDSLKNIRNINIR